MSDEFPENESCAGLDAREANNYLSRLLERIEKLKVENERLMKDLEDSNKSVAYPRLDGNAANTHPSWIVDATHWMPAPVPPEQDNDIKVLTEAVVRSNFRGIGG